jgi:hypothetical protein
MNQDQTNPTYVIELRTIGLVYAVDSSNLRGGL